jgi:ATP-binding cassette subfamily B protein
LASDANLSEAIPPEGNDILRAASADADGTAAPSEGQTGLATLIALARHHGLDLSLARLTHLHPTHDEPEPESLAAIARKEGLQSAVHRGDLRALASFAGAVPFAVRLDNGAYAVVVRVAKEGVPEEADFLVYNPRAPEAGVFKLSPADFARHWSGDIVLVRRKYTITDESQPFGLRWFFPEFWRQRDLFRNVVAAALILHVLGLAVPIFFQIVIDRVLVHMSFSTLEVIGFAVIVALGFDAIMTWLRGYFVLRASTRIDMRLARITFSHLLGLPIGFFEQSLAGVVTKHMQQASQIREFLTGRLLSTMLDLPVLVVFLPILFLYSAKLATLVLATTLVLAGIIALLIGPFRTRLRRLYRAEAERQSLLVETIHGARTVKALSLEPRRQQAWEDSSAAAVRTYIDVRQISLAADTISHLIEQLLTVGIIVVGALQVMKKEMSIGELVAFNMLAGRVTGPILQMVGLVHHVQEALMSVKMLGEIMNRPVEKNLSSGLTTPIKGEITLERVSFRYPGVQRPTLDRLSVTIPAGALIGIVGRSGSGKTTLSALLQGLYFPEEGQLRIDRQNIRDFDLSYLRGQIGVVPQDPFLFRGSVRDNIRIARATASFDEIVQAAQLAGASSFIEELPQGYDTLLEEGGSNLSGGQKQRLSIARALLRNPPILILDEATSALDPESEAIVVRNLAAIAGGRTTIVISHRLQTIRNSDFIIVMDEGKIVDQGNHDQLLSRNLLYRQLWTQQMGRPS